MAKSKTTKKWAAWALFFTALSILCMFGPMVYFAIAAYMAGGAIVTKFALTSTLLVVGIMTIISLINKHALRSRVWIYLIAISLCLNNFTTLFYIFAGTQVLDELVISPIAAYCRERKRVNKDIDKRMEV